VPRRTYKLIGGLKEDSSLADFPSIPIDAQGDPFVARVSKELHPISEVVKALVFVPVASIRGGYRGVEDAQSVDHSPRRWLSLWVRVRLIIGGREGVGFLAELIVAILELDGPIALKGGKAVLEESGRHHATKGHGVFSGRLGSGKVLTSGHVANNRRQRSGIVVHDHDTVLAVIFADDRFESGNLVTAQILGSGRHADLKVLSYRVRISFAGLAGKATQKGLDLDLNDGFLLDRSSISRINLDGLVAKGGKIGRQVDLDFEVCLEEGNIVLDAVLVIILLDRGADAWKGANENKTIWKQQ
jgi:hypothetical protein